MELKTSTEKIVAGVLSQYICDQAMQAKRTKLYSNYRLQELEALFSHLDTLNEWTDPDQRDYRLQDIEDYRTENAKDLALAENNYSEWEKLHGLEEKAEREKKPLTNLENIKSFTKEEMTAFICGLSNRESLTIVPYDTTIEWLESEVTDG
jgi:hypothetical protein